MEKEGVLFRLCKEELIPRYEECIRGLMKEKRLFRECYSSIFAEIVTATYENHKAELEAVGLGDLELFGWAIRAEYDKQVKEYQEEFYQRVDPAVFVRWEEERSHEQEIPPEQRQALWEDAIEACRERIPQSRQWELKIDGLVRVLRNRGRIPPCESDYAARLLLWNIVYLGIVEKTGPAKIKKGGAPRRVDDIVNFGYLSNKLRGEFGDDGTVEGERAVRGSQSDSIVGQVAPPADPGDTVDLQRVWDFAHTTYPPQTIKMLEMFRDGWVQREIAEELGVHQTTVSREITKTLLELKEKFKET